MARTVISAPRTVIPSFRVPRGLVDIGVTHLWDFRTGFDGTNSGNVASMMGGPAVGYAGTTALSSVYTAGTYQADLERNNSDYFISGPTPLTSATVTSLSLFAWVNTETNGSNSFLSVWNTSDNNRSFLLEINSSSKYQLQLSQAGTATTRYAATESSFTGSWQLIIATYDTTDFAKMYSNGIAQTVSLAAGTDPTSIFNANTPLMIGAQLPSAPATFLDGKIGICGIAYNKVFSAAERRTLYDTTNSIGRYI